MRLEHIGPCLSLSFNLLSLTGYAWAHKWPMVLYWTGASIITVSLLLL
jgi:hypothetical protein